MTATIRGLKTFNRELRRVSRRLSQEQAIVFFKKLGLDLLRLVVQRTPVDSGRARGNWQLTVNVPASGETGKFDTSSNLSGGGSTEDISALSQLKLGDVIFLTNNVPYIVRLERGWSKQAPKGMLTVSIRQLREDVFGS